MPASKYRPAPYLYREGEILALMAAARRLRPPLRAATFETLIGLLACTGLRIGEALRLDRDDVDLEGQVLTVRDSKFGKSREVLLHQSTVRRAGRVRPASATGSARRPRTAAFFITTRGTQALPPDHPPAVPSAAQAGRHRAPIAIQARSDT